ncbi:hypothetical protein PC116_g306 [Phytophthora cactorum]|nr:hypothetical protein PC116_g306 [Phytophthora cactorum]
MLFDPVDEDQDLGEQASHHDFVMRSALLAFLQHLP